MPPPQYGVGVPDGHIVASVDASVIGWMRVWPCGGKRF